MGLLFYCFVSYGAPFFNRFHRLSKRAAPLPTRAATSGHVPQTLSSTMWPRELCGSFPFSALCCRNQADNPQGQLARKSFIGRLSPGGYIIEVPRRKGVQDPLR